VHLDDVALALVLGRERLGHGAQVLLALLDVELLVAGIELRVLLLDLLRRRLLLLALSRRGGERHQQQSRQHQRKTPQAAGRVGIPHH
jgi:hypothetical protein